MEGPEWFRTRTFQIEDYGMPPDDESQDQEGGGAVVNLGVKEQSTDQDSAGSDKHGKKGSSL